MLYVLTTPTGRVFEFYVRSCAELYRGMYGGTLVETDGIMQEYRDDCADADQLELL